MRSLLLTAAAGGLLPLAFSPWEWWWLAPLPLAVLFRLLVRAKGTARAALYGYAFGLGLFGFGVSWVHVSLARFGGGGPLVALGATALLVAVLALFPAAAAALGRWLRPKREAYALLAAFPACWVLLEWVRTWAFTGFPWLLVGYSQTDSPLGAAVAPVAGVLGVSALVAIIAGALAWLCGPGADLKRWLVVLAAGVALGGASTLAADQDWTRPSGTPLQVALVQGNIGQGTKWDASGRSRSLARYRDLTMPLWGADLVVWPETALPLWLDRVDPGYLDALTRRARESGTALVLGVPTRNGGRAYNSAVALGTGVAYHKRHLVPFGEYVPLRAWLGDRLDVLGAPMSDFSPGSEPVPLPIGRVLAGVAICYEIAFGTEVAALLPEASVLINISNDAWFGDSLGPRQHLQIARMRALETERYVLRATNTGLTAMIAPDGEVTAQAPPFQAATLVAEAEPREGSTPYVRWTDAPLLATLGLVLGPSLLVRLSPFARARRHGRSREGSAG